MKLKHFILLILISPFAVFAQTLRLAIQDEGKAVYYATIEINKVFYSTNSTNLVFSFPIKNNDEITIKHEMYEDFNFVIPDELNSNDTLNKVISLTLKSENMKLQMLEEFTISDSKYRDIFDVQDEFIIDYHPFPLNRFFVITRIGKKHFLKIIDLSGEELLSKNINFKPKEIFLDAVGNFHLVEADSVYQVYTDREQLQLMQPITRNDFEIEIRNLVTLGKQGAFHQKMTMHNQMYTLNRIINKEITDIYQTIDNDGYENASYHYQNVINYYMLFTPLKDNIIVMGIWDGDLMTLNNYSAKILEMTSWSDKIASKPLNVTAFGLQNNIIVLDGVRDSVFQINNQTFSTKEVEAKFEFTGQYFKDYFYDNIYMYTQDRDGIIVSKINIEDGTTTQIAQLAGMRQPRNIKVINDKVYFTKLDDSQYNRIVEVK